MKDLFADRLSKLENLEDRRLLKGIINSVFANLAEHSDQELEAIRQRVFSEIEDQESKFDIFTGITNLEDYDLIDDFYFPMQPGDTDEASIDLGKIEEELREGQKPVLTKLYLDMDYLELKDKVFTAKSRRFRGELETTEAVHPVEISIRPHTGYLEQIEELYHCFLKNDIPWRTVLHPYLNKFIDIILETPVDLQKKEQISEVRFDLEELEVSKKAGQIPVWNICTFSVNNAGFSSPARDQINFEHTVQMSKYGEENGFLVDGDAEQIKYIRRTKREISIVSPVETAMKWQMRKVVQHKKEHGGEDTLLGNHRKEMFTDRFARRENHTIRSMCEISRIVNTFQAARGITLENVEIRGPGEGNQETYELNPFIRDNIRVEEDKKVMQLTFAADQKTVITRDKISFLVSEIQLHFPEFKCVGELL